MADRLKGKVAVVTGAAPRGEGVGNGMATAILFAREGAKVVLVNRSAERAEKLANQIKDEGGEASVFAAATAVAMLQRPGPPMPSTARPPDRWSRVRAMSANRSGLR